jgi:hypothetical protein
MTQISHCGIIMLQKNSREELQMSATSRQIKFIDDILLAGCPYPMKDDDDDKIDFSFYDSVENADRFIRANKHWLYKNYSLYAFTTPYN